MRILIAEPKDFSQDALEMLREVAEVDLCAIKQKDIRGAMENYDMVWVRLHLTVRQVDIPEKPRCRYLISATTGLNHLDVDSLKRAGVNILSLKGETTFLEKISATAEHTIGLLLSVIRHIPASHRSVLEGNWQRDLFKGNEIAGKTIGIVGYGRLGKIVARYCSSFLMNIIVHDPYVTVSEQKVDQVSSLDDLVSRSDVISLHVPLNEETISMIDSSVFSKMKRGAWLINTSRGELIDEKCLLESLRSGRLAGAALDVVWNEDCFSIDNPLIGYAKTNCNLIITPHIGGCTWESMSKCEKYMARKFLNVVDKSVRLPSSLTTNRYIFRFPRP